jgi:hypothetical protein
VEILRNKLILFQTSCCGLCIHAGFSEPDLRRFSQEGAHLPQNFFFAHFGRLHGIGRHDGRRAPGGLLAVELAPA